MYRFTGEYECKVDSKGRVRMPSALVRQIPKIDLGFTLNRGFEKHLILYPKEVWDKKTVEIDRLNIYNKKHRQAIRFFYRGATQISMDSNDRLLMPRSLMEYAGISGEVILFAYQEQVEIWAKDQYEAFLGDEPEDFSAIADDIFGGLSNGADES